MYFQRSRQVPKSRQKALILLLVTVCAASFLPACSAFRVPEEPATPTPVEPVWSEAELREHIRFLNRSDIAGRTTGTQGYARAAAYVSARMQEFGLQPAVEGDFRVIYSTPINYPLSGGLRVAGPSDSLDFLPAIDFLPDGRSDSGAVAVSRFVIAAEGVNPALSRDRNYGIIVPPNESVDLQAWRDAGAQLAVVIENLNPRFERAPIRGMLVTQVTSEAARQMLRIGETALEPYLADRRGEIVSLGRAVHARVRTTYEPQAGAINMMGYFSGKHPVYREQLVIVCADLDAVGQYAGIPALDLRNLGTATASLLEVARNIGYVTRRWQLPERSILVAIWSGARVGHAGLRNFLESPTWPLSKISSIVYVGLEPAEQPGVRSLLSPYGIPLIVVPPPDDPSQPEGIRLLPDQATQRIARSRNPAYETIPSPDLSQLIDSSVVRAVHLADSAYTLAMIESTYPAPFMPTNEDTIPVPPVEGTNGVRP